MFKITRASCCQQYPQTSQVSRKLWSIKKYAVPSGFPRVGVSNKSKLDISSPHSFELKGIDDAGELAHRSSHCSYRGPEFKS